LLLTTHLLQSPTKTQVVVMVEVQLVLQHYMDMRQHTHLYYKVVREPTWSHLALDCLPDNVEVVGAAAAPAS
jgi:hypothetical protein